MGWCKMEIVKCKDCEDFYVNYRANEFLGLWYIPNSPNNLINLKVNNF